MYRYIIFISFRFLYNKKADKFNIFIAFLSTIGIAFGIFSLILVLSIMNGFEKQLEKNILNFIPQIILADKKGFSNLKNKIKKKLFIPEIKLISPIITSEVLLQSKSNVSTGIILGIFKKDFDPIENYLNKITKKKLENKKNKVILGKQLAHQLQVKIGDTIKIIIPDIISFSIIGKIPKQRLFKIIDIFESGVELDNYQILLNYQDAAEIMNYFKNNITGWRIYLKKPLEINHLNKYKKNIEKIMIWKDWKENKGELFQAIKIEKNIMITLISLMIFMSALNFITFISLLVVNKQDEISILQTHGMKKNKIMIIFLFQGIITSILGSLIGTISAIFLAKKINFILFFFNSIFKNINLPIVIYPIEILIINIITIATCIIFTIYPAYYAGYKIRPLEILRNE